MDGPRPRISRRGHKPAKTLHQELMKQLTGSTPKHTPNAQQPGVVDDLLDVIFQFGQEVSETPSKAAGLLDDAGDAVAGIFKSTAELISESVDVVRGNQPRRRSVRRRSTPEAGGWGAGVTPTTDPLGLRSIHNTTASARGWASPECVLTAEEEELARRVHQRGRRRSWQMGVTDLQGCKAMASEATVRTVVTPPALPGVQRNAWRIVAGEKQVVAEEQQEIAVDRERTQRSRRKSWQWGIGCS
eukprot:TRINITY_DN24079_c0_g1_i2.p1 TRINITY_DN24079_c0_g1~~TRINITY_DN24079_c0_g1_i2.p1  ORF type:complete len:244 (+),score=50.35 TRINITY_DN24079_c0_g1_i2:229-960(+)